MRSDSRLQAAARVGERFHIDPVTILRDSSEYAVLVRQAAYDVVMDDERKRNEAEKAQARSGRKR